MEIKFKRVHTTMDLAISVIVILAGCGLFFLCRSLGICIAACGLLMLIVCKRGYKKNGQGTMLTKFSEDLSKTCKSSLTDFLSGKDITPAVTKGNEGGIIRLDVYYNRSESLAYAQLHEFSNFAYRPVTEIVEFKGKKAEKLIASIR